MTTVKSLKAKLDELGVEYNSKASKAELEVLALKATRKAVPVDRPVKIQQKTARDDIKITCMVETMDGNVHEKEYIIVHPTGVILRSNVNNPDYIFDVFKKGLINRLGAKHVK